MSEAARRVASLTRPTWIMAHSQTSARGRRGRTWLAPTGNLSATLVYKPIATPAQAAQRSFFAANALYAALAHYVPANKLALKWPNDVLFYNGKIAGILLESSGYGTAIDWLSVGVGVNLSHTPDGIVDAAFAPTSLNGEVTPTDFLTTLAVCYQAQEATYAAQGFEGIRESWLKNVARLGEVITARTAQASITGIFDTIDADGNLVLITGAGPQAIPAADVYF